MSAEEIIKFLNHIKVWIPNDRVNIRTEIDEFIKRLKGQQ